VFNLATYSMPFRKVRQTNATDAAFPARTPTATEPSGVGDNAAQATASAVFDLVGDAPRHDGRSEKNRMMIVPFGAGADTNTLSLRVIGWRIAYDRNKAQQDHKGIWIPVPLCELLCTLSTPTGVANRDVVATDLFADTIALTGTTANDDVDISITSPANNTIAHAVVDMKGFQKVEIIFQTGSSATDCNALGAWY
jgi:hypothetical protein